MNNKRFATILKPVRVATWVLILGLAGGSARADFDAPIFHASEIDFTPHRFGESEGRGLASSDGSESAATSSAEGAGSEPEKAIGMPQACQLSYRVGIHQEVHCSGALVAPRIVLTASHCFESDDGQPTTSPVTVGCGYVGQDASGKFSFAETFTAESVDRNSNWRSEVGSDFAFLHLDHSSQVEPLDLPDSISRFQEDFLIPSPSAAGEFEFAPSIECRFSGYGYDPVSQKERFKTSDQSPKDGLKGIMNDSALLIDGYGNGIGEVFPGDSGGPLYCRKDATSPWVLVAILSAKAQNDGRISAWSPVVSRRFIANWLQIKNAD